jgi:L-iditol 2-dehydrogenase
VADMRAARLHGIHDLRVETVPVPEPGAGELLVRVEGCGICPTDIRKWLIGVNDGDYPFNPGHEWVGVVEAVGPGVAGWEAGARIYGDTYAGYAELAVIAVEAGAWSHGPLSIDRSLSLERAIFVEPLADCLHAVVDRARVAAGDRLVVLGAGQMGLQLVLAGAAAGARVLAVEPLEERRELALSFGAEAAVAAEGWEADAKGADAVILSIGDAALVPAAIDAVGAGGRVVLFAGFGDRPEATIDLNAIHYREVELVGSEWIGPPPTTRRERYREALALLESGAAPLERLVTLRCGLEGIEDAFEAVRERSALKALLVPSLGG